MSRAPVHPPTQSLRPTARTPSPAPGGAPRQSRLVSCSSDRTLVARRREDGRLDLVKIFEAGSLEDARKELANARSLALPGIKAPREAWIDPVTGRPALVMDYVAGQKPRGARDAPWPAAAGDLRARRRLGRAHAGGDARVGGLRAP
jgi:hypothetical protein